MGIDMNPLDVYKNKKILVTGHTGFKGSWLTVWLNELKAKVIGFSLPEWENDYIFKKSGLSRYVIDERGDISDLKRLNNVFAKHKPEIVFHLAAQPLVRDSYVDPAGTFSVNTLGTVNVLECIRRSGCTKAGVLITTDKCYKEKEQQTSYKESDELGGHDPYSTSKAAAELAIDSYRKAFFSGSGKLVASARAGNNIGGGDFSKDRIIPDCIRALKENKPIKIRNPESTRPWQHVLDSLSGYLLLGSELLNNKKEFAEAWNFGPDKKPVVSVSKVASLVIKNWGSGEWVDTRDPNDPREAKWLSLDVSKAEKKLKWRSKWSIEEAMEKTISWYKNNTDDNVYELCADQTREYSNDK
jgi:CDP-glucose 4,6-dehydratase